MAAYREMLVWALRFAAAAWFVLRTVQAADAINRSSDPIYQGSSTAFSTSVFVAEHIVAVVIPTLLLAAVAEMLAQLRQIKNTGLQ